MKYIMLEDPEGLKIPVMFGETLVHKHVAEHMIHLARRSINRKLIVASAGFVSFTPDGISTFGESESLGIKSNPVDGLRIQLGEAVNHMPDFMITPLGEKIRKAYSRNG